MAYPVHRRQFAGRPHRLKPGSAAASALRRLGLAQGSAPGVNAKALSTYMGHSGISITSDRCGHLIPGNENEAAALADAYLERANTTARVAALDG